MTTSAISDWVPLTSEQAARFDRDGFLHIPAALEPDTVTNLIEAGDRLVAGSELRGRRDIGFSDGFRNVIALDPAFLTILCNPRVLPLIIQLMGPQLQLHTSDLIWKKPDPEGTSDDSRSPGWHRDYSPMTRTVDHDRMPRVEIKAAYYLTPCPEPDFGQTLFAAGSHRWRSAWQRKPDEVDPPGTVALNLQAGDAVLFENRTWHAGSRNRSNQIRKTLMMGYSLRWVRPDDYDVQEEALLNRCNPLERSLLEVRNMHFDEEGRFRPNAVKNALQEWAATHGYQAPACY